MNLAQKDPNKLEILASKQAAHLDLCSILHLTNVLQIAKLVILLKEIIALRLSVQKDSNLQIILVREKNAEKDSLWLMVNANRLTVLKATR